MISSTAVVRALADLDGVEVIATRPGSDVAEIMRLLRETSGVEVLLVLIDPAMPAIDRAMLLAAIGPLAVERAPDTRINAIAVEAGAAPDDVIATARFLAGAGSTTGQVLIVKPEQ